MEEQLPIVRGVRMTNYRMVKNLTPKRPSSGSFSETGIVPVADPLRCLWFVIVR